MLMADFLCALTESVVSSNFFYKGQVNSEMTKSLTYFTKVAISPSGKIIQSQCECGAGAPPKAVCKHVAVVCYAVLKYQEGGVWNIRKTVIQKQQVWHAPKKARLNISPQKAEDLKLDVNEYGKSKKQKGTLLFDPRPDSGKDKEQFSDYVAMSSMNYCFQSSKRLGICGILPTVSTVGLINDHDYFKEPLSHYQVLNMIKVTPEEAKLIEESTRKQAYAKIWHFERAIRVTASNVGDICHFTERRDQEKYAENLVSPVPIYSEAVLWGKSKEPTAIECYEAMSHNTVQPCGLTIDHDYNYIAGSPDGLICELTVLEVKCPFSMRDEGITPINYPHIEIRNNELQLKKTSKYYFQVQTQMLVTKREFCDFFIWTNVDEKRISVARDDDCIQNIIIPRVTAFYHEYMIPVIHRKYFS